MLAVHVFGIHYYIHVLCFIAVFDSSIFINFNFLCDYAALLQTKATQRQTSQNGQTMRGPLVARMGNKRKAIKLGADNS